MMKKLLVFFILVFFFFPAKTFAAPSNFTTQYQVTYTINSDALTHVNFHITLTNLSSRYYASSYTIHLGFQNMQHVTARDPDGSIVPNIIKSPDDQSVQLDFNRHVVGIGNALVFDFSFDTTDVAQKEGAVWEINIPGLSNKNEFSSFDVAVVVPPSLGKPQYIKPDFGDNGNISGKTLHFTKDELRTSGISLAFGASQNYAFHLTYHLGNNNVFPVRTEIALPPDTNYQKVFLNRLSPKPSNVRVDTDGNWLAEYHLAPSQKYDVIAEGVSKVGLFPQKETLTTLQLTAYTEEKQYWETGDSRIQTKAKTLKTPQEIYNYLVKTLHYDFNRVAGGGNRLGAVETLLHPDSAVCLEFTDLFIALARASGIPARELDGYAFTKNSKERPLSLIKDVLHAWPQYYDKIKQEWIMVDPTWGNTTGGVDYFNTLDFDHFAFVVKGMGSSYPVPAGGYKLSENENQKDIAMTFADVPPESIRTLTIKPVFPIKFYAGFSPKGDIVVTNTGTVFSPQQEMTVATNLSTQTQHVTIQGLPPFGSATIPITLSRTSFLTNKPMIVTISLNGQSVSSKIAIFPLVLDPYFLAIGGISCAVLFITTFIITTRRRRLSVPQPAGGNAVRGQGKKSP